MDLAIRLRPIDGSDVNELKAGLLRLSPETRIKRFHTPVTRLSDEQWRYLTEVDGHNHVAYVACLEEHFEDAAPGTIVGVGRFIRDVKEPNVAEVAFVVHDRCQRRGVGRALRDRIREEALARGIDFFRAHVLASNLGIRRLLQTPTLIRLNEREGAIHFWIARAA
jgi:GNAT superfamily N-acetyltransferase